jgi:hypothetical protein
VVEKCLDYSVSFETLNVELEREEEEGCCLLDMALIDCSARFATVWVQAFNGTRRNKTG